MPLPVRPAESALIEHLRQRVRGDVRFDRLSRAIYASDASIYEIVPLGAVLPRDAEDVALVVRTCGELGASVIARGAGTGLTGGAVGAGVQLDLSRYMNGIGALDVERRTIDVQPGVVLDELNRVLRPHGLHFAPDVATASRATIGGMIGNNSCGAHSIRYGRTVDHLRELTAVIGDGSMVTFRRDDAATIDSPGYRLERGLSEIRDRYADEIARHFPKVMRSNGGYGLDRLGPLGTRVDATRVLCGSEGTLGVVVSARLALSPLPAHRELVLLAFDDLLAALTIVPELLAYQPAAVELVDRLIIDAGRANPASGGRYDFLPADIEALLAVEFFGESPDEANEPARRLLDDAEIAAQVRERRALTPNEQATLWDLRNAGLGLMMSRPGDEQPYSFIEDAAVDPTHLRTYIERLADVLRREGVHAGYYAHASVGCLHVKPVLNLKRGEDVARMKRIAEASCDLVVELGGAVTGEHGDGIVRSGFIERVYGPRIVEAFREVKRLFDPAGVLNPHKIIDPHPMTEQLRLGPTFQTTAVRSQFDFAPHEGMAGLVGMCSGVGQCRQRMVGAMCPSYIATGDERHTTRARANALRLALSNKELLTGLDDEALDEVMDLCLSCKACKTECPTGVDMARLKSEWLFQRNLSHGVDDRSRLVGEAPLRLRGLRRVRRIASTVIRSAPARWWLERRYGLDRRMPLPKLARRTFREWFRRRKRSESSSPRPTVVYFVDTWTDHFTPEVGRAAVSVLERLGFEVICPPTVCCGRPAISKGLLAEAKQLAEENLRTLSRWARAGVPIVGTEPSCLLTLIDEYPAMVADARASHVADQAMMLETFLLRELPARPEVRLNAASRDASCRPIRYHAHCHQKALVGSQDAVSLLRMIYGDQATEINSGCCGMAGSFGHEVEHYEIARLIGEERLFPAVRARGEAEIAVSGFSCRQQIDHHTGVTPRHLIEVVAEALG